MPDFDTRRPEGPNEPNRLSISLIANKLRNLLIASRPRMRLIANKLRSLSMASKDRFVSIANKVRSILVANRLRTLLLSGGILLFVVAVPVGLLIYSFSGMGDQQQQVMDEEDPYDEYLSVCSRAEDEQQGAPNEELNGKIAFVSHDSASVSASVSGAESARASSAGPVSWYIDVTDVCVMNANGTDLTRLTNTRDGEGPPAWSPDGKRIAFVSYGGVYVISADGSNRTKLPWPEGPQPEAPPGVSWSRDLAWSPDGKSIAFQSDCKIYIIQADGSGAPRNLTADPDWQCASSPTWSPDGKQIAFSGGRDAAAWNPYHIYVIEVSREDGTNQWRQLTTGTASDATPSWSPDGTEIAFANQRSVAGRAVLDIYKINLNTSKETRLTNSSDFEYYPTWSPDGEKIAFSSYEDESFSSGGIYLMDANGSNPTPVFEAVGMRVGAPDWQPQPQSGLRCKLPLLRLWC